MCRHAAYVGSPLALRRFLTDPPHSLVEQAFRPREMVSAIINADGYGVGWYLEDGSAGVYANPMPIWSDANLDHLGRALASRFWMANVRSATRGLPVSHANTHPFLADGLLFSHNGFVEDFTAAVRAPLRRALAPDRESTVRGTTDSEYLFALVRQEMAERPVADALRSAFARLDGWLGGKCALLNVMIGDGERVYATRHALRHESPSLYVGRDPALFGDGWLVASEPLSASEEWAPAPDGHLAIVEAGRAPRFEPL